MVTDHEPLKHFHTTKKLDLQFNKLKAALRDYDFDVIYRPGVNARALSRSPVIPEGGANPDHPRVELYELASDQEREDSVCGEKLPPARMFVTRAVKHKGIVTIGVRAHGCVCDGFVSNCAPRGV